MASVAERFYKLFAGLNRAYGRYDVIPDKTKVKQTGKILTLREPATPEIWKEHLAGKIGIGIVPITDEGTCRFGAIDIDVYDGIDYKAIAKQVSKLPLIACRTKSGGVHLYLFCMEDVSAELVRGKLMEWAVHLGFSGVEVFPKQTRLAGPNDYGNWINMPYQGGDKTERYAIYKGKQLTTSRFLSIAESLAVSAEALEAIEIVQDQKVQDHLEGAPPCLQTLAMRGFGEGSRNNGLFNLGVYLRKRYEDQWTEHLDEVNQTFMDPPLGHKEVQQIERSVARKNYQYRCHDQPIVSVCNRQICLTRSYGVGTGAENDPGVVFGGLSKVETDPPVWIWDVDGKRIELTTSELKDQNRFQTKCMNELNKWPRAMKPQAWSEMVREKLEHVELIEAPPDARPEGIIRAHLEQYCTGRARARTREDLLMNKPWTNDGRTYFSGVDFCRYLDQQRFHMKQRELWAILRKLQAEHHFFNIKSRGINVWSIPAFDEQSEPFSIPPVPEEDL